eukprot:6205308-Pleurochrysis_carterae.AAC.4
MAADADEAVTVDMVDAAAVALAMAESMLAVVTAFVSRSIDASAVLRSCAATARPQRRLADAAVVERAFFEVRTAVGSDRVDWCEIDAQRAKTAHRAIAALVTARAATRGGGVGRGARLLTKRRRAHSHVSANGLESRRAPRAAFDASYRGARGRTRACVRVSVGHMRARKCGCSLSRKRMLGMQNLLS